MLTCDNDPLFETLVKEQLKESKRNSKMKDMLNKELSEGDFVVLYSKHYASMKFGIILKITPCTLKIISNSDWARGDEIRTRIEVCYNPVLKIRSVELHDSNIEIWDALIDRYHSEIENAM